MSMNPVQETIGFSLYSALHLAFSATALPECQADCAWWWSKTIEYTGGWTVDCMFRVADGRDVVRMQRFADMSTIPVE